jgi:hypothetical protein
MPHASRGYHGYHPSFRRKFQPSVLFWVQAVVGSAALQEFEAFRIRRIGGFPFCVDPTASYCVLVSLGI